MKLSRTMTLKQIDKAWSKLTGRHQMETAETVARYCIGHKIEEVAERLGQSVDWVHSQLDLAGIGRVVDGRLEFLD